MEDYAEREWEKVVIANGKKWDVNISRYCQDGWKWYDAYIYHYGTNKLYAKIREENSNLKEVIKSVRGCIERGY